LAADMGGLRSGQLEVGVEVRCQPTPDSPVLGLLPKVFPGKELSMTRPVRNARFFLVLLCFLSAMPSSSRADFVEMAANADARVLSVFPSNNDNSTFLSLYNQTGNVQRIYLDFDLTSQAGQTVTGDGVIRLIANPTVSGNALLNGQLFLAAAAWSESTVTWNNQPGATGLALSTTQGNFALNDSVNWTVPQAVLQSWIDSPLDNHGVVLMSDFGSTLLFRSKEFSLGSSAPRLSFNTVPEPTFSVIPMLLLGWLGMARRRATQLDRRCQS